MEHGPDGIAFTSMTSSASPLSSAIRWPASSRRRRRSTSALRASCYPLPVPLPSLQRKSHISYCCYLPGDVCGAAYSVYYCYATAQEWLCYPEQYSGLSAFATEKVLAFLYVTDSIFVGC